MLLRAALGAAFRSSFGHLLANFGHNPDACRVHGVTGRGRAPRYKRRSSGTVRSSRRFLTCGFWSLAAPGSSAGGAQPLPMPDIRSDSCATRPGWRPASHNSASTPPTTPSATSPTAIRPCGRSKAAMPVAQRRPWSPPTQQDRADAGHEHGRCPQRALAGPPNRAGPHRARLEASPHCFTPGCRRRPQTCRWSAGPTAGQSKAQVEIYARGMRDGGAPVNITYPGMVLGPPVGDQFGEAGEGVAAALQLGGIPAAAPRG